MDPELPHADEGAAQQLTMAVPFADLRARVEGSTRAFAQQMRDRGIAVLRVGPDEMAVFDECTEVARAFFANTPMAGKLDGKMGADGERDWCVLASGARTFADNAIRRGYVEMPGVKEFWQMRNGAANPFGATSARFFEMCSAIGETVLASLARDLQTQEHNLVDAMVDARDAPLSSTIFRFFHYYATAAHIESCQVHTDIGLVTLIPASNLPSLEVMDFDAFDWYNFEQPLQRNDVMVLCGETLERLTAYYYRAVVHRVRPTREDRFSLVWPRKLA